MRGTSSALRVVVALTATLLTAGPLVGTASAAASLTIEPITWDVIGLDHNNIPDGPHRYLVGARVCNVGDARATAVTASFAWRTDNDLLRIVGPTTLALGGLAAGACADAYFDVGIEEVDAAFDTARGYVITATADGLGTVSTPEPRQLVVERLISQNRNEAVSFAGETTVYVGQRYTYTVNSSTATGGYSQLISFLDFPASMFRVIDIHTTYENPPLTTDLMYADACGWDKEPTSPTYRSCVGPEKFPGGKAGGDIITTYTVEVVGTGTTTLRNLIYDYSGSSYHYNSDFNDRVEGVSSLTITAQDPPDVAVTKTHDGVFEVDDEGSFEITVANVGGAATTDPVTLTDTLPAGTTFVSAEGDGWTCTEDGGTVVCTHDGAIEAGETSTVTITVGLEAAAVPEITNEVEVDTPNDSNPDNDTAVDTAVVQVPPSPTPTPTPSPSPEPSPSPSPTPTPTTLPTEANRPALRLAKTSDHAVGSAVAAGDPITYTIVVENIGAVAVTGILVSDPTPANTAYVAGSLTVNGTAIAGATNPLAVAYPLPDLAPGAKHTLTYRVIVGSEVASGTVIRNGVTAQSSAGVLTTALTNPVELPRTGGQQEPWSPLSTSLALIVAGFTLVGLSRMQEMSERAGA